MNALDSCQILDEELPDALILADARHLLAEYQAEGHYVIYYDDGTQLVPVAAPMLILAKRFRHELLHPSSIVYGAYVAVGEVSILSPQNFTAEFCFLWLGYGPDKRVFTADAVRGDKYPLSWLPVLLEQQTR